MSSAAGSRAASRPQLVALLLVAALAAGSARAAPAAPAKAAAPDGSKAAVACMFFYSFVPMTGGALAPLAGALCAHAIQWLDYFD